MPGWILVANRFSLLTIFRKYGGLSSAVLPLVCLVVLTGCSNLRQQSLELPLPVLPSQAAVEADEISAPVLPLSETDAVVADSAVEGDSALNSSSLENDFDIGFKQTGPESVPPPTTPSYRPTENDLPPPQLQARFVGVLDKAEMSEVKLKAVSKMAPAPSIGTTIEGTTSENCQTPEVCNANTSAQCDCCKKKELPKLAVVDPVDPEQLPKLFGGGPALAQDKVEGPSFQSMLQPLRPTNATLDSKASQKTKAVAKADANSPIRLTAMQGSEITKIRSPFIAAPTQTQNRAQLLFPIAPEKLKEAKAEAKLVTTQAAETLDIKVSPVMDLNSAAAESSTDAVAMVTANEAIDSPTDANKAQAKFIPVSSSEIRVSAIPFKSFSPAMPRPPRKAPARVAPKSVVEPTQPAVLKKIVEPTVLQTFEPKSLEAKSDVAVSKSSSNVFKPLPNKPAQTLPVVSADSPVAPTMTNEFTAPLMQANSAETKSEDLAATELNQFVPASPSANIDPLADYGDLPDMSQIEKGLAEFKKVNTFNPSTVGQLERIDPAKLLAKLDGPPKKIAAPVEVVETAPKNDLLATQLSEIQRAIEQFKSEPVAVAQEDPELTLTLNNAAFCTKITGFGQFTPFAANTFSSSQKTLLYCEVENQTSKRFTSFDGSDQFETVLHGAIVIYDANDQVVQTAKFPAIKDIARKQRRDFYVYFPVQFNELASGDYHLELSVQDVAGNETAVLRPFMRFSVK